MSRVVGYEGTLPEGAVASWQTAILDDGQSLFNPVTHRRFSQARFDALVEEGHATPIRAVSLPRFRPHDQPVVYIVAKGAADCAQFRVNTSKYGPYVEGVHSSDSYRWVFAKRSIFDVFREEKQDGLVAHILADLDEDAPAAAALARAGLALGRGHAALNAVWVHFTAEDRRSLARRLADAGVTAPAAKLRFQTLLASLSADHKYKIKFDGGIAEGGGLDIDAAADTLGTLRELHSSLAPEVACQFGFLAANQVPQLHLQELLAASASLVFSVRSKGKLRDQVARYLELSILEECIAGQLPQRLAEDSSFCESLDRLLHPSDQTTVEHTRLGAIDAVGVHRDVAIATAEVVRTDSLRVFCFLIGIYQNSERAEVMLASPFRRRSGRVTFSLRDRGDGERPEGLELFDESNDFLYRPFVVDMDRQILDNGTERYLLQDAVSLDQHPETVFRALPSSVVPGAFLIGREYKVRLLPGRKLVMPFWQFELEPPKKSLPTTDMAQFMAAAEVEELERASDERTSWLGPSRAPVPGAADRCIVALRHLGGSAVIGDVLDAMHDRYNMVLTSSNTLTVCKGVPSLVLVEGEGEDARLSLTPHGASHASVYARAGGDEGRTPPEE